MEEQERKVVCAYFDDNAWWVTALPGWLGGQMVSQDAYHSLGILMLYLAPVGWAHRWSREIDTSDPRAIGEYAWQRRQEWDIACRLVTSTVNLPSSGLLDELPLVQVTVEKRQLHPVALETIRWLLDIWATGGHLSKYWDEVLAHPAWRNGGVIEVSTAELEHALEDMKDSQLSDEERELE